MGKKAIGTVYRVSGPVVVATGLAAKMYDLVKVGEEALMGEVIEIRGDKTLIQVYENTTGLRPGEKVASTGQPLSVELGPGLLSQIYDGVQRPLQVLREKTGDFIGRGVSAPGLDHEKKWCFQASVKKGDRVQGGDVLGTVQENETLVHRVLVPPGVQGKIASIQSGDYTVDEVIARLTDKTPLRLMHAWPVRRPRPYKEKLFPNVPLLTGQRILDTLFPLAKGGTAAIPGPFGSGKTVTQQSLAKWSDADVIVYVGCGERGNEMTEVLTEFPKLHDVRTGRPLFERTVLIANTSNMPVAAREASIYAGVTLAEYFRDQGYDVALMADSTSRWAEAMREISSRLEEMPGEEGYPAYVATRLAEFYERAGRVRALGSGKERVGSVTMIGAVSPPGGDFSEPVTQNTLKVTKVFWALDAKLAQRRHFPAIHWLNSYSLYVENLRAWFSEHVAEDFAQVRTRAMQVLQKEAELQEIVQLVGSESLPEKERVTLETARLIREAFLQQNAFHEVDAFCSCKKQYRILKAILAFDRLANSAVEAGAPTEGLAKLESVTRLVKAALVPEDRFEKEMDAIEKDLKKALQALASA